MEKKLKKLGFHVKGARIISKMKAFSITMFAKTNQARLYYPLDLKALFGIYRLMHEKRDKSKFKISIIEKFKKTLYSFTCILPDYMGHEVTKIF